MNKNTTILGAAAETVAAKFYTERGYALITRNFRSRVGELDLILWRDAELLVVEVKGRRLMLADEAWYSRWAKKKQRMRGTLRWFLARHPEWVTQVEEYRLEIVYVTQGRVKERFEDEPFF